MNKFDFAGTLIASGLILFANTTAQASEVRCADLHATTKPSAVKTRGQLTENYKTVRSFIENFYYLDRLLKILSASDKPTWEDYILIRDTIKAIKVLSKDGKGPLNSTEKEQLNADFDNMKSQLIENLKQIREKKTAPNEQFSYQRFLDYHISYFRMLEDVNRLLQFKAIPIPDLSAVKSDAVLKRDAKKILKNLENITDSTFHLSGHKNLKAFEEYAANYNELAKKSLDLIQNHLAVAMHRPEGARFWIPLAGFQNQRITG
ncbi:MAG: hypothetical protein ACAH59_02095, partial [Pseudobdellovibrionaceae bacterium]